MYYENTVFYMITYCKLIILNILKRDYYYYLLGTIYNMLNYVWEKYIL